MDYETKNYMKGHKVKSETFQGVPIKNIVKTDTLVNEEKE